METKTDSKTSLNVFHEKTRFALLWMNVSNEPFIVLYALLAFILRKDLGASLFQIAILSSLRPVLPVFSFYWSANITNQKHLLRLNLIVAWIVARAPFLLVPWFHNVWYLIFCCAIYELFNKSGIPALIEILKINIPKESREKTYTLYFVISFLESILLGIFMAGILDHYPSAWKLLCCCTAFLSLSSIIVQIRVPIKTDLLQEIPRLSFKNRIIQPWKEAFSLLKKRADFAHFQYGFMIGGFGLMLIAPSLAFFYVDQLQLTHSDIVTGRSILMGIGVVLSSYFWRKALARKAVPQLTLWILTGFALYPLLLVFSQNHMGWFYLSFICYGIAQAGSHLLWNLSGRNIKYGVREFAMAGAAAGLAETDMIVPYVGTFLTFSDYMRNAIRLAALSKVHVIYQFTHDSIFLGEDGPTHQPIEHLAALRAIPNLQVIRPADNWEVKMSWIAALRYRGPSALILSRQSLPELAETNVPYDVGVGKGAYILRKEKSGKPDFTLMATGSEVWLALDVATALTKQGKSVRVISMPCWEIFEAQSESYRQTVIGGNLGKRVSIEAATSFGWHKWLGPEGIPISIETFGESAPYSDLQIEFGFNVDAILHRLLA